MAAEKGSKSDDLPTVSVIITNFNYGAFVEEAIRSVVEQTYPNIEIVVVDDVSSDNSWELIQVLTANGGQYAQVNAIRLTRNRGHGLAAAAGLATTRGPYVIFLDADDILLPTCVEAHIYAHLSSRVPVGFSSVDTYTLKDQQYITATYGTDRTTYIQSGEGNRAGVTRRLEKAIGAGWFGLREPVIDLPDLHLVPAPNCEWVWAPMSGNCFRRSALDILLGDTGMDPVRSSTDNYLMYPIAALCGSMLIDKPLMAYRIHGTNTFMQSAPLARLTTYKPDAKIVATRKAAVRKTFAIVEREGNVFENAEFFFDAVVAQCKIWPELMSDTGEKSFLVECIFEFEKSLHKAFGEYLLLDWLRRCGVERRRLEQTRRRLATLKPASQSSWKMRAGNWRRQLT